ncbi:hypothetical protein TNCV_3709131 [Trichonephila clavipes]|nr:hypothetical protein TNCV_3709131 [Trichonephila clavipes]
MEAVIIDATRVEVALTPLGNNSNISIFRGGCKHWATTYGSDNSVWFGNISIKKMKSYRMMNAEENATSLIDCPASMHPTARQCSESSISSLEVIEIGTS